MIEHPLEPMGEEVRDQGQVPELAPGLKLVLESCILEDLELVLG